MYVCVCNALTDRQVRKVADAAGHSAARAYRCLGVRPQCGKCVPMMREILRALTPNPCEEGLAPEPMPA